MNPTNTTKASLFGKVSVLALCLSVATVTQAANTLNWTAATAGDLMEPTNWDKQTVVPASGDKLTVDGANGVQLGVFTFPERMPTAGVLNTLNFTQKNQGKARSMDPGKNHALNVANFNFRYNEVFSILSGRYFVTESIGVGNSSAASDTSYLTVSGEDTFVNAPSLIVGTGSDSSNRSIAHVLVTDKAVVDSAFTVGIKGGWKNSLVVSGLGTRLDSTNAASRVGTETIIKGDGTAFYSRDNFFAVTNQAMFIAKELSVGSDSDLGATGNVFLVSGSAASAIEKLNLWGTNTIRIAENSCLNGSAINIGSIWKGVAGTSASGSLFEVRDAIVEADVVTVGGMVASSGNKLCVLGDGVLTSGKLYICATNQVLVSGMLVVTNSINVGRVDAATDGVGGAKLKVCGGAFLMNTASTFYIGTPNKVSNGNNVSVTDGGQLTLTNANYLYVGAMGRHNELTVSGVGSRLAHYPINSARSIFVGCIGKLSSVEHPEYTGDNELVVSDGASLSTTASVIVGENVSNSTFTVNQATAIVGQNVEIGNGSVSPTPALMKVVGSNARLMAKTLKVGAEGRIVFDLADAKSSAEALVQLASKPTFTAGSTIYITSSNPDVAKAEKFDATLLSCAADMDLSNVSIEIDPESGLRRWAASNPRALCVRGGRPSGLMMIFR